MNSLKINVVPTILAVALAALAAYAFYSYTNCDAYRWVVAVGSGLMLAGSLFGLMGFTKGAERTLVLMRVISLVFFIVMLISNIVFCSIEFKLPAYIIVNGAISITYVLSVYYTSKTSL